MTLRQQGLWPLRPAGAHFLCFAALLLLAFLVPAAAQDVRGLEVCTAEKQMERRTGCLQANIEFLQQALAKLARETQDRLAATGRDLAAARAEISAARTEITALKATIVRLDSELAQMKAKSPPADTKK
jgi:septal ring factor EnvC (AmiA/AmiB activator)